MMFYKRHLFYFDLRIFTFLFLVLVCLMMAGISEDCMAWPIINGITICTSVNNQYSPKIISDGLASYE